MLVVLQAGVDGAAGKKPLGPWWGTFKGHSLAPSRPGLTWDVNYTLRVKRGTRTFSMPDARGTFTCVEQGGALGEKFSFDIPAYKTKVVLSDKKYGYVFIRKAGETSEINGQTPSGRNYSVTIRPERIVYNHPRKRKWIVWFHFAYGCDGGLFAGGRDIPSYAVRQ